MKPMRFALTAILWKEWREARWFAWAGILLFIIVPALQTQRLYSVWARQIPTLTHNRGFWRVEPSFNDMALGLGIAFAAMTAVGVVARDLRWGATAPWRQVPIRPWLFVAVKFLLGLFIVMAILGICTALHLIIERFVELDVLFVDRPQPYAIGASARMALAHMLLLPAVFAICFALAALLRPVLSAFLVCVIAIGLLMLMPLLWPALSFINFLEIMQSPLWVFGDGQRPVYFFNASKPLQLFGYQWVYHRSLPAFLLSIAGITTVAGVGGLIVAIRGWRIELNAQRVAWTLAIVLLGLFGVAAGQVGSNLTPVEIVQLFAEPQRQVVHIQAEGGRLLLATASMGSSLSARRAMPIALRLMDWEHRTLLSDPAVPTPLTADYYSYGAHTQHRVAWSASDPGTTYFVEKQFDEQSKRLPYDQWKTTRLDLVVMQVAPKGGELARINLKDLFGDLPPDYHYDTNPSLALKNGRLYMVCNVYGKAGSRTRYAFRCKIIAFDVTNPASPAQVDEWRLNHQLHTSFSGHSGNAGTVTAPAIPGLSAQEQFDLLWHLGDSWNTLASENDLLVEFREPSLRTYTKRNVRGQDWHFSLAGSRPRTPLERFLRSTPDDAILKNGLLYVLVQRPQSGLIVFDMRDPTQPRKLGHYYAPGEQLRSLAALDDGRVIAAGHKLHVFDLSRR